MRALTAVDLAPIIASRFRLTPETRREKGRILYIHSGLICHSQDKGEGSEVRGEGSVDFTFDSSGFEVMICHMIVVGIVEKGFGRNTSHVQTRSS